MAQAWWPQRLASGVPRKLKQLGTCLERVRDATGCKPSDQEARLAGLLYASDGGADRVLTVGRPDDCMLCHKV